MPEPVKGEATPVTAVDPPEGFQRVRAALAALGHPHAPRWLEAPARTSAEAAQALGVTVAQIAKSVVFRLVAGAGAEARGAHLDRAVLVVASGDKRVDEKRVSALVAGPLEKLARADAEFVKARTGFSIGGVAPLAHREPPLMLIDRELFASRRFGLRRATRMACSGSRRPTCPRLTGGAPVADVVQQG